MEIGSSISFCLSDFTSSCVRAMCICDCVFFQAEPPAAIPAVLVEWLDYLLVSCYLELTGFIMSLDNCSNESALIYSN